MNALVGDAKSKAALVAKSSERARIRRVALKKEEGVFTRTQRMNALVGVAVGDAVGDSIGKGPSSSQITRAVKMLGKVIHCPVCQAELKCGNRRARNTQRHWNQHENCLNGMEAMVKDANHKGWTGALVLEDKSKYDWADKKKAIGKQLRKAREKK